MAVGARLILPSITPVGAGTDDRERRVSDGRLAAGGLNQDATIVSSAQPAQPELGRREMIDAGRQAGNVAANHINLDFVERPSAGRRTKINLASRIPSMPSDAAGKVE